MAALTYLRLKEVLRYEPDTGRFYWLVNGAQRKRPGDEAGSPSKDGRIRIRIDNELFYRYRLAWLYMTSKWPTQKVDHINGNPADDRWQNLRDVSQRVNIQNRLCAARTNKSGLLGVSATPHGTYTASIRADGKRYRLGTFPTAEQAHSEYMRAKRDLHHEAMRHQEHK